MCETTVYVRVEVGDVKRTEYQKVRAESEIRRSAVREDRV